MNWKINNDIIIRCDPAISYRPEDHKVEVFRREGIFGVRLIKTYRIEGGMASYLDALVKAFFETGGRVEIDLGGPGRYLAEEFNHEMKCQWNQRPASAK